MGKQIAVSSLEMIFSIFLLQIDEINDELSFTILLNLLFHLPFTLIRLNLLFSIVYRLSFSPIIFHIRKQEKEIYRF